MTLAEIERTKLLANWLDRASTSVITVGVLTPLLGYALNLTGFRAAVNDLGITALCFAFLFAAGGLHWLARDVLKELEKE